MHNLQKLKVYQIAKENLKQVTEYTYSTKEFGDLKNQIQRSALSVVSNIAEGSGSNSNANFKRFLGYAKASNRELYAQLEILNDINNISHVEQTLEKIDHVSAMLYRLIEHL